MINVYEYYPQGYIEGGYYFFTRPSTVGIIRMWVLIEGWYYYQIQRHLHTYYVSKTRVFAWRHKEQT